MSHPMNHLRQHKIEKSRVSHIAHGHKHRKSGGRVHSDEAADRKLFGEMIREHDREVEGKRAKHRHDKPQKRAHGGKVHGKKGGKGSTHVNVIVGGPHPQMPMMPPASAIPPPPPTAGLAGPPPMPPGGASGGMPPMPMRARGGPVESNREVYNRGGKACRAAGGKIYSDSHTAKEPSEAALKGKARKDGGSVKSGPAWDEGRKAGTRVQHSDALSVTKKNMNRGRVITFKSGGGVKSFKAYHHGPIESPKGVDPVTKRTGGAGGAAGRRVKVRDYGLGKPMKEQNGAR